MPSLLLALLFLIFVAAKAIVFATTRVLHGDRLHWAILFIASGYSLLGRSIGWPLGAANECALSVAVAELLMALIGRVTMNSGSARAATRTPRLIF